MAMAAPSGNPCARRPQSPTLCAVNPGGAVPLPPMPSGPDARAACCRRRRTCRSRRATARSMPAVHG
ncbi:hypothetical protein LHK_02564 [Laribacter hongkongensis HLHK9]|uniref:Uncharacterized protein n=1 Tax=Laribacter hongkongensis (strain HLHK9) TaxID=557598 RepID=C1DBZ2_LARHH|nr:hypothetical protein LHK_02564 [Laribacter hongkongensis HLHK9]